ncbi:isopentenyl-diphosphate Delta-isomerase [uncultured Microbacterium sp.]|uniref:isopentenyl-diphosphate Delta-isomerase n=1 Tax=uncultured Microbacterium sp. TaxID=191216 RepID=UPI0025F6F82D|nr:isopentenyl-diphosphate Delta-isomerase [uncultured Microbacterium sp.]
MSETEYVVLLDDFGNEIGTAPKADVHDADTRLHLAFSCHVVNSHGQVLVTRRALHKKTWPGVWTNSFCGHPGPGEAMTAAVHRRGEFEVGLRVRDVELALPTFRYRAVDASGIVEHEICPVYVARTDDEPQPHPDEVAEYRWVDPLELAASLDATPWAFSPWLVLQAQQLHLFDPAPAVRRAS